MKPACALQVAAILALFLLPGPGPARAQASAGRTCAKAASTATQSCVKQLGKAEQRCYRESSGSCPDSDPRVAGVLDRLRATVMASCSDPGAVADAGLPALLGPSALADRLAAACTSAVASIAARSYGGPHAATRSNAPGATARCLDGAGRQAQGLVTWSLRASTSCVLDHRDGKACDTAAVEASLERRRASVAAKVAGRCEAPLRSLLGLDPGAFAARAGAQARCLVATVHGDASPLELDCGPREDVPPTPRGASREIVLPFAEWGTRCGDGSDYAFHVRLAPEGSPVERIVIHMQGGGGCYDGPDCAAVPADRFEALTESMPTTGMMSSTAATNPFRDWTKVSLPYCTQDLHIGGGVTNDYDEITVHRYGAINVRTALAYVRDLVWATMDAEDPRGYRGDLPLVVLSGSSAGGYGAAYNYHWVLDDLGWVNATAVPDAALGMDNGSFGVIALGTATAPSTHPGWNTEETMPPYCLAGECAEIFGNLLLATAPRLLGTPWQRVLHVSNQVDNVQRSTTLFPSTAAFVNAVRTNACRLAGIPGLHAFLSASTASIHGQVNTGRWDTAVVAGALMRDWVGAAMSAPTSTATRVELGTLASDYPGVEPFPCTTP